MTVTDIMYGTRCRVYAQASGTGATTNATEYSARVKEISMSGGERSVEEIKTLNNNEILRQNPQEPMEVELTTIKTDSELAESVYGGSAVYAGTMPFLVTADSTRKKYRVWLEASGENADDWKMRLLWNHAYGISAEHTVDAEGYMEETIKFRCSAGDYSEQWTGSYTTKAISALPNY